MKKTKRRYMLLSVRIVAVLLTLSSIGLFGQSFSSLNGSVRDPKGSSIPHSKVTLMNPETGAKRATISDAEGQYSFAQIAPGRYRLTVEASGFAVKTVNGLELLVNTPSTVNLALELSTVTESITVEAQAAQVNITDASLGNAMNTRAIVQLPLEARNPALLLALQPGVTYFGSDTSSPTNSANKLNGSVNGSRPDQNNITLDGMDVNDQNTRSPLNSVLRVTLDSVQEFRTTTQNPTAEQGRGSGAQIALLTKGGTNNIHGSLYEFNRNTSTSANSFFNNQAGVPRQKLNRNVFGASLGGPIKKDKLFFFANYEGRKDDSESTAVRVVPTATFRQGTVRYLNQSGGVSSLTPAQLQMVDPAGKGVNPAVTSLFQQYPMPNDSTQGDGFNTAGYRFTGSTPLSQNTYIAKVDYAGLKNQFFVRGNLQGDKADQLPQFPGQPASSSSLDHGKGMAAGWTWAISPSLLSTVRYGFTRYGHEDTGVSNSPYVSFFNLSTLNATTTGLTRIIPVNQFSQDLSWTKGRHTVAFGGLARIIRNKSVNFANDYPTGQVAIGYLEQVGFGLNPADVSYAYSVAARTAATDLLGPITKIQANYQFDLNGKVQPFGQPLRRNYGAEEYEFYANDSWRVAPNLTVNLGLRYSLAPAIYETNGYQVSPTTNLGDWFYKRGALANAGISQASAGDISYVLASSANGKPLYDTQKTNFSPRLAIAYSPSSSDGLGKFLFGEPGKTSIRAGVGMFYDLFGMTLMRNFDSSAPGLVSQQLSPFGASLATQTRFAGSTVLPTNAIPVAPKGGFPYSPSGFSIATSIDQGLKQPYSLNPSFSIGREFANGWFVQGSYVARLSRRSLVVSDLAQSTNLRDPKSGQTYYDAINALAAQGRLGTPTAAIKPQPFFENLFSKYAGGGLTATQQVYAQEVSYYNTDLTSALVDIDAWCYTCSNLGPNAMFNSQYSALFAYRTVGKGDYHGMQWSIRKRTSRLLLDFNYTFAKSIDLTSAPERDNSTYAAAIINPYNSALNRAVSDFDVRHSVNGYAVFEVPFGKGQPFGANLPKWADNIAGGWQLGGLYNITSGLPHSVLNGSSWPTNWSLQGFATAIATPPPTTNDRNAPGVNGVGGPNIFSNPVAASAAFGYTYAGQIGSRNVLRGDGFMSVDVSLSKRFVMPYRESHSIQFRVEAFNLPNAVRFDINTASLDLANTGTFGKYSSLLTTPRVLQFGLRYEF